MEGSSAQASTIDDFDSAMMKHGGARPGAGRPPSIVPDETNRARVERMAGLGMTLEMIGAAISEPGGPLISKDAVLRLFPKEVALGRAKAGEKISATLFERAMAGDTACLIWWSKTQLRWSPAPQEIRIQNDTRVSIVGALEAAQARVIEGEAIERVQRALEAPDGGECQPDDGDAL